MADKDVISLSQASKLIGEVTALHGKIGNQQQQIETYQAKHKANLVEINRRQNLEKENSEIEGTIKQLNDEVHDLKAQMDDKVSKLKAGGWVVPTPATAVRTIVSM